MVEGLNHFTVLTDDVDVTVRFYADILGFRAGDRPNFAFPGAWLYAGDAPIVHIVGGRDRRDLVPGVLDHMAFSARGLAETLARLDAHDIEHVFRRQPGSGTWQVFFHDPNGAKIELDFSADEEAH